MLQIQIVGRQLDEATNRTLPATDLAAVTEIRAELITDIGAAWHCAIAAQPVDSPIGIVQLMAGALEPVTALVGPSVSNHQASLLALDTLNLASSGAIDAIAGQQLADTFSHLFVNCTDLDVTTAAMHNLLTALSRASDYQGNPVISLRTPNVDAQSVQRSGTTLTLPTDNQQNLVSIILDSPDNSARQLQVVTVASAWAVCRDDGAQTLQSIELISSNGSEVILSDANAHVEFSLPLSAEGTTSALQSAAASQCAPLSSTQQQQALLSAFSCAWWDPDVESYSTTGCITSSASVNNGTNSQITCRCSHLTEFTALLDQAAVRQETSTDPCDDARTADMGNIIYLILASCIRSSIS